MYNYLKTTPIKQCYCILLLNRYLVVRTMILTMMTTMMNVTQNTDNDKDYSDIKQWYQMTGGSVGVVVRALAFHQCGPGSISALGVKCGSSLLVLYSAMRGFSPGTVLRFSPLTKNQHFISFDLICRKQ